MNKQRFLALSLLLFFGWPAAPGRAADSRAGRFVPPDGKVLLSIGQDPDVIDAYVEAIGNIPAGFTCYTSLQNLEGLETRAVTEGGPQHSQYLMDKYPNTFLQLGLYMVDALDDVNAGRLDKNIDKLAGWIKSLDRPVYLRPGYEFDGPHNHYNPKKYKKAFRRIVKRFREKGAANTAFVWHSSSLEIDRPMMDWYPGDDVVDWVAISYFRQDRSRFEAMGVIAKEHNKPLMIAEAAPMHYDTSTGGGRVIWKVWFKRVFRFMEAYDVKMLCYINCDWDTIPMFVDFKWRDNRIQSSPELTELWKEEISKDKFLNPTPELFKQVGFPSPKGKAGMFIEKLLPLILLALAGVHFFQKIWPALAKGETSGYGGWPEYQASKNPLGFTLLLIVNAAFFLGMLFVGIHMLRT